MKLLQGDLVVAGAVVALILIVWPPILVAQIGGGSIVGFVQDPSSAAIAGAKVNAVNIGTAERRETVTNEQGDYEFPLLPAGRYQLQAEAPGFERAETAEFDLNSGTKPRIDLRLVIGQVTQTVEVISSAPLVNARKVESLPLNGRNWAELVSLQAGVVNAPSNAVGNRGGIESNGSSSFGNNLVLDGIDMSFGENQDAASDKSGGAGGGSVQGKAEAAKSGARLCRGSECLALPPAGTGTEGEKCL